MKKKINYSIIIPHYNSQQKLQRCIESLPIREDVEIIVVDDNSSPSNVDFDNFPGRSRENMSIILSKIGGGAGYARNQGLLRARGKWVLFSDADDEFYTDNLSFAMDKYIDSSADIVYFNVDVIDADSLVINNNRININKHISSGTDYDVEWLRYNLTVPWGKFIKKKLIDTYDICFDEVLAGNDVMFSLKTGHFSKETLIDNIFIYKWYIYKSCNISSLISKEALYSKFGVAIRRLDFLIKHQKEQYRSNLFIGYVPFFKKAGYSIIYGYYVVFKNTPIRYRITDTIEFISFVFKKLISKI